MKNKDQIQDQNLKDGKILFEDELVRNFDDIIEKDEKIIKGYKPNKKKVFVSKSLSIAFLMLFFVTFAMLALWMSDESITQSEQVIGTIIIASLFVLIFILNLIFVSLYYKNTYYVYTNKRIIIRTGVFGVDYHSLDLKNIGASDVCVSLLDKIVRKNTGSIVFGSNSSPIGGEKSSHYDFSHIEKPYEVYKEIKEYIQEIQNSLK